MTIKGYVVKGQSLDHGAPCFEQGAPRWLAYEPTGEHVVVPRRAQATEFQALGSAIQAWADAQVMCSDARIFAVAEDGTETPLPNYEEVLTEVKRLMTSLDATRAHLERVQQTRRAPLTEDEATRWAAALVPSGFGDWHACDNVTRGLLAAAFGDVPGYVREGWASNDDMLHVPDAWTTELASDLEATKAELAKARSELGTALGELEGAREREAELRDSLQCLFGATRELLDARETAYHPDGRATVAADLLNALDEASEDVQGMVESDNVGQERVEA